VVVFSIFNPKGGFMKKFYLLGFFKPMFFIGIPLFRLLTFISYTLFGVSYLKFDEKYMIIRPSDAFLYVGLCGWATVFIILTSLLIYFLTPYWWLTVPVILIILYSIKVFGKIILDDLLQQEEEAIKNQEKL
jgi:hypothetical protein